MSLSEAGKKGVQATGQLSLEGEPQPELDLAGGTERVNACPHPDAVYVVSNGSGSVDLSSGSGQTSASPDRFEDRFIVICPWGLAITREEHTHARLGVALVSVPHLASRVSAARRDESRRAVAPYRTRTMLVQYENPGWPMLFQHAAVPDPSVHLSNTLRRGSRARRPTPNKRAG